MTDNTPNKNNDLLKNLLGYSALAGIFFGISMPASAQMNAEKENYAALEEITVTAQKRQQNLQEVGIAISAFSGGMLDKMGVTQSSEVADLVPGVHISGNLAGQNTQFTIRGVTQNDFNDIVESPNAVYLDEGYIAIAQGQSFATFDIDRVEILKGPQGTLFGRNATGGLVHYISRQPTFEGVEGYVDGTVGLFDTPANAESYEIIGALNIPFSDKMAARFAVKYRQHDGYLKNNYPEGQFGGSPGAGAGADLGDDDTFSARSIFLYQPNENLSIRLSGNYSASRLATGPYQSKPTIAVFENVNGMAELVNVIDVAADETRASIAPDGSDYGSDLDNDGIFGLNDPDDAFLTSRFGVGTDFFGYVDADGADFTTSSDFAFKDQGRIDTYGINLNIGWDVNDSMTLTAISDFKDYEKLLFIDVDSAPVNQSANYAAVNATSFTQEVRLNGEGENHRWVGGLFYLNIDNESDNGLKFPVGSVVPGAPFDLASDARLTTNSYSAFGQIEYDINDKLTFIVGARIIREEKDYEFSQNLYFTQSSFEIHQGTPIQIGPLFNGPGGSPSSFVAATGDTLWAGNLQLNYRPNDDLLLFSSIKRGVKAGSFNAQLAGGALVPNLENAIPYKEEILYSYELGFKKTFADGRGRFNGNAFYYDYNDYQAFLFTGVSGIVVNADAEYFGADLELQFMPVEGLLTQLSGSWINATVKDVPLRIGGPIVRDVDPTYTPEFQFSGLVRYEWAAFDGMMSLLADASWSDSFFYNLRNFDADQFDSYFLMNARLGWTNADETLELALQARNLTDARAGTQGFDLATLCGCNEVAYRAPRWFGFNIKYNFN
ncbi:TonB-dependent receptor [hydrothermal vent metagenome]|uniref:TonB-dependent receptor n=1 Tax=hydrothermal vent metagenome TaxID=652676 RepID=A0A3B1ATM6_9ZZZZ